MAQRNLRAAADAVERHPRPARAARRRRRGDGDAGATPPTRWSIPFDEALGVHPQSEGFTEHAVWDFDAHAARALPAAAALPVLRPLPQAGREAGRPRAGAARARRRVHAPSEKRATSTYYEALTVRDSSLSACTQAVVAAEVGHLELAYDYFARGGAHRPARPRAQHARRRCTWRRSPGPGIAAVAGFGGLRDHGGALSFRPRLPPALAAPRVPPRLPRPPACASRSRRERRRYTLRAGEPLEIEHHGEPITLTDGRPVTAPVVLPPARERPVQPAGREPARRLLAIRPT